METYLIVKIKPNGDDDLTTRQFKRRVGLVRKALHASYDVADIHGADVVAGIFPMTSKDSKRVTEIFGRTMGEAKRIAAFFKEHGFYPMT